MDELQRIITGVMVLVVCDIFYHICLSKVRAYNSKGELKNCCNLLVDCFMYILLLLCRFKGTEGRGGGGGGYKGRGNSAA